MSPNRVLIVHCDPSVRMLLSSMLQTMNLRVEEVASDRAAVRMLDQHPFDAVLACVDPAEPDALELLSYVRRKHPAVSVVLLCTTLQTERVREALQWGATSVLRFPSPANHLRAAVAQALGWSGPATAVSTQPAPASPSEATPMAQLEVRLERHGAGASGIVPKYTNGVTCSAGKSPGGPGSIIGESPCLRQILELSACLAASRAPLLLLGERGSGKTLMARHLHQQGPHAAGPLVSLDASDLAEDEVESAFFGSGDPGDRPDLSGLIARAQGGTLVIDNFESLPLPIQSKLHRVIQEGQFDPAGASRMRLDVRFIFTSRGNPETLASSGQLQRDLLDRISLFSLRMPPLRQRGDDVLRIAEHFRKFYASDCGRDVIGFTNEAADLMRSHDWTGNVAELRSAIERAVVLCRGPRIEARQLALNTREIGPRIVPPPKRSTRPSPAIQPLKEALEEPERRIILEALESLNWNRQETARLLDINRTTLYKKMKKYGLLFDEPAWAN